MRKHLVLLIAKYCRILKAVNRLKCGKKLRSSVFSTLNKLRHSLARLDKARRGKLVTFKSGIPLNLIIDIYNNFDYTKNLALLIRLI